MCSLEVVMSIVDKLKCFKSIEIEVLACDGDSIHLLLFVFSERNKYLRALKNPEFTHLGPISKS